MTTPEHPAVQDCRQTLAERDARIAELEAASLALARDNHRLRLSLAVHQKLLRLPAPIVHRIIDEHAAKASQENG